MKWLSFVDLIQKSSAVTSIVLNIFLTFLIFCKSPKQLGSYKYLMIYISWFEIIYSILDVVVSPIMFSHGSIVVLMVYAKNSLLDHGFLLVLNGIHCAFFGASMGMFGIHFIYRYFAVTGSPYSKTFNGFRIVYWMIIPIFYGGVVGSISYFILTPSDLISNTIANKLMLTFGWEISDIIYLGAYFYHVQPDGSYIIDLYAIIGVFTVSVIIFSSLVAIFYCGIRCYLELGSRISDKSNTTNNMVSSKFKNLQSQLFNALVIQTAIPLILMHIPFSIVILFTFLDIDLGTLSGITSITIALFPALDPLPSMFIIQNYRKTILGFFRITKVKSILVTNNNTQ